MSQELRCLFTSILIHCHPNSPGKLWKKFKDLSQDFYHNFLSNYHSKAYHKINNFLSHNRSDIRDFPGMPSLNDYKMSDDNPNMDEIPLQHYQEIGQRHYYAVKRKAKEYC